MSTDPVRNVLEHLDGVRQAGPDKWEAFCPVHEKPPTGHKRSLSVKRARDGRVLVYCHGCGKEKTPAIVEAIGLTLADLHPPKAPSGTPRREAPRPAATTVYESPAEAAKVIARKVAGEYAATWTYYAADGTEALSVLRFNLPDGGKTYRPIYPSGGGWSIGDPPGPLPLYRLADLDGAPRVYVLEGEKCADAAAGIGLTATTSAHGAKSAARSDWTPLAGREVAILPDNDPAGRQYFADVAAILTRLTPPATIRIVDLPGLPEGGDIAEYLEIMDAHTPEDLAAGIAALADAAPIVRPAADSAEAPASAPVLIRLADVQPEPLRWLWPNRIPLGKVTLLFGDPGLGKSLVTLDSAARVSRGMPWPDAPGERTDAGGVILLSAEDDVADTIRPRLDAAGADVGRVTLLQGVRYGDSPATGHFNLARDLPALEAAIRQTPDARLVIIDPISAYLGGTDSHKNADIRGLLAPLADLAARQGVAVLAVTHMNKGAGGRALYRATGSLAFIAAARAAWLVIPDADNPHRRLFLPAKSNLAKEPSGLAYVVEPVDLPDVGAFGRVAWEPGAVALTADDALAAAAADPEDRTARESAAEWLKEALANGPMTANDVKAAAKESGLAWRTVRRAQVAAGVKVRRQGFGPGAAWYWFLPGHDAGACGTGGQSAIDGQHTGLATYEESGATEGAE